MFAIVDIVSGIMVKLVCDQIILGRSDESDESDANWYCTHSTAKGVRSGVQPSGLCEGVSRVEGHVVTYCRLEGTADVGYSRLAH
jgi:hypothetical protein